MKNDLYVGFATIRGRSWNVSPADTGGTTVSFSVQVICLGLPCYLYIDILLCFSYILGNWLGGFGLT
jgi:hypothetical protein